MGQGVRHFKGEESDPLLGFIDDIQTLGLNDKVELPEVRNHGSTLSILS